MRRNSEMTVLSAGARLGPYEVVAPIGAGGMGEVYRARDTRLGRTVAIKVLAQPLCADEERRARFEREARTISTISHPHVCALYDVGRQQDTDYLVMEYIEGETLAERLERGPLRTSDALELVHQIADGLAEAHAHGIVHRDLKPANVMVTRAGHAKILDFGLARRGDQPQAGHVAKDSQLATLSQGLSREGTIVGTLAYMSPEQARGEEVDSRSDVFSFGVTFYQLLTGQPPFRGESATATIAKILESEPEPPLSSARPDLPAAVARVVRRCLQKKPEARYNDTRDLVAELKDVREELRSGEGDPTISFPKPEKSIVVLPFENMSSDNENEYFSAGLTEEITADLSKLHDLLVISRSSAMTFKGTNKRVQEIAKEVGVRYVLEGSVRKAGNSLRITAQLIDAANDAHLWAEKYSGTVDDVFDIQERVSRSIVDALRLELTPQERARLVQKAPADPAAHEQYLRGRYHLNRVTPSELTKAIEYFEHATRKDPVYALAYAGLANAYNYLGWLGGVAGEVFPQAKRAAVRALEIDETLAEAHAVLGYAATFYDWDWATAERELDRAIALNPNYAEGYLHHSWYLGSQERHEEARAAIVRASELDPLSLVIRANMANYYHWKRDYDGALAQTRRALELSPKLPLALLFSGMAYCGKEQYDDAARDFAQLVELAGPGFKGYLGYSCAKAGREDSALAILDELTVLSRTEPVPSFQLALVRLGLGRFEEALTWLEKAFEERAGWFPYIRQESFFDPLRGHPRFQDLVRRLNFPKG